MTNRQSNKIINNNKMLAKQIKRKERKKKKDRKKKDRKKAGKTGRLIEKDENEIPNTAPRERETDRDRDTERHRHRH